MSLGHKKIGDKNIDGLMDDVYRILNQMKNKLDKLNIVSDEDGQAFLEITTDIGKARSAINAFQVGVQGNRTILGDLVSSVSTNYLGNNVTGSQIYNIISYIPKKFSLSYSEFGSTYDLFTIEQGYVIDKIDIMILTAFDNSAQIRINDGSNDLVSNAETAMIMPLLGRHEYKLDYSKYASRADLKLYTTNSPSAGSAVIIIHFRNEDYDTKTAA